MNRFLRYGGMMAFVVIAVFVAHTAHSSHRWNNYHWARTVSEFDLLVVDSATTAWQSSMDESLHRWGLSSKLNNVITATQESSKVRKRCAMVSGQIRVCNASYGQNGWLGMATINLDANGHITRGTAKMNDSYGWYFAQTSGENNHVMCQEIGHLYGLGHTSEDGSIQSTCMDYSRSLSSQWPNQHDYDQLVSIYGHTDSYNSYAVGSSSTSSVGICTAPPGKGCNRFEAPHGGVPAGATRVHYRPGRDGTLGHADYVLPDGKRGLWVYHLTLLPEDAVVP